MKTVNVVAMVLDALKTFPEQVSFPDNLEDSDFDTLAEARSRLQQVAQCATELRKLVDARLASELGDRALMWGGQIIRSANGRGSAKVKDPEGWWAFVTRALYHADKDFRPKIMNALYPASSVRLTGLKMLATAAETDEHTIRSTFIEYDHPTSPLSVMPKDKAPKYLQDLEEGEIR